MLKNDGGEQLSLCFPLHLTITFLQGEATVPHASCACVFDRCPGSHKDAVAPPPPPQDSRK
ncbi:hypothetical protein LEMLEM_LOCUS25896 [Lemmus lemmus]